MKIHLGLLLIVTSLLAGCQAMGDHFRCLAQVNQTVPEQTKQVYVRTETKCKQNFPYNEMICNAVPVYDTVITNQPQRDAAMAQCQSGINSQRAQPIAQNSYSNAYVPATIKPKPITTNSISLEFLDCWARLTSFPLGKDIYSQFLVKNLNSANKDELLRNKSFLTEIQKSQLKKLEYEGYCINNAEKKLTMDLTLQKSFREFSQNIDIANQKLITGQATISQGNKQRLKAINEFAIIFTQRSGIKDAAWTPIVVETSPAPQSPASTQLRVPNTQQTKTIAQPTNSIPISMEQAKAKCLDLGFKTGTESFGQCVLKLAK